MSGSDRPEHDTQPHAHGVNGTPPIHLPLLQPDKFDSQHGSDAPVSAVSVCRVHDGGSIEQADAVAVEEPLEIRLGCTIDGRRRHVGVSVTMRTPGDDVDLAIGFLFTEGIISHARQVAGAGPCGASNVVRVDLQPGVTVDLARLERHFYTASSCGVCGKASLEAVRQHVSTRPDATQPIVDTAVIRALPRRLRADQAVFDRTGGLHAAALFDADGHLLCLREDVGRHNALDKLIGQQFLAGRTPLTQAVLLLSGRISFELVQKAAVAGIPIVAAVGAPSSLAIDLAREHQLTVIGFVREDHLNIYTGAQRVRHVGAALPACAAPVQGNGRSSETRT